MKYFENKNLLGIPVKRAAFSDRTCYVMIELARLAYLKFEDDSAELEKALEAGGFKLVSIFSDKESEAQAFLCTSQSTGIAVLSFRGTESDKLKDIQTDIRAELTEAEFQGKQCLVHSGYWQQFSSIKENIAEALTQTEVKGLQLFITGHSLGGALAIIALKYFESNITGACYTFGSPPVGTENFDNDIHTPIYRVINHLDIVPYLPSPFWGNVIRLIGKILHIKNIKIINDCYRYRQSGYNSYLTGKENNIRLRYSVPTYDRFIWWFEIFVKRRFRTVLKCHSTDEYLKKIKYWAETRIEPPSEPILK
jgi:triacylglycerol lipase